MTRNVRLALLALAAFLVFLIAGCALYGLGTGGDADPSDVVPALALGQRLL